jgi:hypothetical protein
MNKEVLQQALEALEPVSNFGRIGSRDVDTAKAQAAITAIKQALAAPEQEPVAWINAEKRTFEWNGHVLWNTPTVAVLEKIPLYTTPPAAQRQWVGLTEQEIDAAFDYGNGTRLAAARAIEAKLKEKNT